MITLDNRPENSYAFVVLEIQRDVSMSNKDNTLTRLCRHGNSLLGTVTSMI